MAVLSEYLTSFVSRLICSSGTEAREISNLGKVFCVLIARYSEILRTVMTVIKMIIRKSKLLVMVEDLAVVVL